MRSEILLAAIDAVPVRYIATGSSTTRAPHVVLLDLRKPVWKLGWLFSNDAHLTSFVLLLHFEHALAISQMRS